MFWGFDNSKHELPNFNPARNAGRHIWRHASFLPYQASLPNYDKMLSRPPIQESYTYAGLGMWCSRGVSLPRAIAAMLGDRGVFYDSPLFILFKTHILGLNVADFVYDTNEFFLRDFSGYNHFMTNVVSTKNATEMLYDLGYTPSDINASK